ncbi:hypothetical protein [Streptomyces sp. ISL-100]|uniref:hypothetical protein n=1 Tax=unclassified Streptomyces TaxID=2593676 RepID=UPI001BE5539A|nr:hypothetical protein [Streptomyces sp. ISL-100]MBT2395334.1 hypothetical protein [Streptomyces sp. ISL-100]
MNKNWLLLALPLLPLLPLLLIFRLLRRRTAGTWNGPDGGPPPSGVREPRRPKPSPPAVAEALPMP